MNPLLNIASRAALISSNYMMRCLEQLEKPFLLKKNQQIKNYIEQIIINTIQISYPYHNIISQNTNLKNYSNDEYTWIISVLDGENNFIHKLPMFSISIAVKYKDRIEHGLIYDPNKNEMFTASRNQGTKLNGKRIRVKEELNLKNSLISLSLNDFEINNKKYNMYKILNSINNLFDIRCLGSTSLSLAYLSTGRISGYFAQHLNEYEIAAGSIIAKESGCYISDYNNEGDYLKNKNIVGANPKLFPYIIEIIRNNKS